MGPDVAQNDIFGNLSGLNSLDFTAPFSLTALYYRQGNLERTEAYWRLGMVTVADARSGWKRQ